MLVISSRLSIPLREFDFSFSRSSGPGGQNVNKVNTKVLLKWRFADSSSIPQSIRDRLASTFRRRINQQGELLVSSQRFRDQGRNVADCLYKLKQMVASVEHPPKARKPTQVSKSAKQRRLSDKRRQSGKKQLRRNNLNEDS